MGVRPEAFSYLSVRREMLPLPRRPPRENYHRIRRQTFLGVGPEACPLPRRPPGDAAITSASACRGSHVGIRPEVFALRPLGDAAIQLTSTTDYLVHPGPSGGLAEVMFWCSLVGLPSRVGPSNPSKTKQRIPHPAPALAEAFRPKVMDGLPSLVRFRGILSVSGRLHLASALVRETPIGHNQDIILVLASKLLQGLGLQHSEYVHCCTHQDLFPIFVFSIASFSVLDSYTM